jgi:hypothetical protein
LSTGSASGPTRSMPSAPRRAASRHIPSRSSPRRPKTLRQTDCLRRPRRNLASAAVALPPRTAAAEVIPAVLTNSRRARGRNCGVVILPCP